MDDRVVEFVRGLRAAGVRVSVAESCDALSAAEQLPTPERDWFREGLRACLVKEHDDQAVFDRLFPLYFSASPHPPMPLQELFSAEEWQDWEEALRALGFELEALLRRLREGRGFSEDELRQASEDSGLRSLDGPFDVGRRLRRLRHALGMGELEARLEALLEALREAGFDAQVLARLEDALRANLQAMAVQLRYAAERGAAQELLRHPLEEPSSESLAEKPFAALSQRELDQLRREATRLAARLRTRLSLRQKRGEGRQLDPKSTLRANLVHAGVPFVLVPRIRRRKAKFTLLCDVSTSMRPVVSFLLYLLFQVQDQVARTRCFAYIDRLVEVSDEFAEHRPEEAVRRILRQIRPGHYNTDLGVGLEALLQHHPDALDPRTTVVFCGDARNNFRPPRVDLLEEIGRRSGRVVWFNPEPPFQWGSEDSDMLVYASKVKAVHQVSNLRQLAQAIDRLFP